MRRSRRFRPFCFAVPWPWRGRLRRGARIVCSIDAEKEAGLPFRVPKRRLGPSLCCEKGFSWNRKKGNVAALLPIGVFSLLYLGLGIVFEYIMGISMGFYNIPIVVVFLIGAARCVLAESRVAVR